MLYCICFREDGLGIGASTDTTGDEGFDSTKKNFCNVLENLVSEYPDDPKTMRRKKRKRKKEKSSDETKDSLNLAQNRVSAGHSRKMREAKDLTTKSNEDMAAIFGIKVDKYVSTSVWGKLKSSSLNNDQRNDNIENDVASDNVNGGSIIKEEKKVKKKKKDKKKSKKRRKKC